MSKSSVEFLRHIYEEAGFIISHSSGLNQEELEGNEVLKRAMIRSLEIIGEAAKKVDEDIRKEYPSIEWRGMARMRDKLIHHYFGVDYEIVLDVIMNKIPKLHQQIGEILDQE